MTWMNPSPKGRMIVRVEGDPDVIKARGSEIESLGQMMTDSAKILKGLADGTDTIRPAPLRGLARMSPVGERVSVAIQKQLISLT